MSQSLIVFQGSGKVLYQQNSKISPFNDLIYKIVDDSCTELSHDFYTVSGQQKRFYCLKKEGLWAAIYFDVVTTLDSEKIKHSLSDVLRTYEKLSGEDDEKMEKLIDFQFKALIKLEPQNSETNSASKELPGSTESVNVEMSRGNLKAKSKKMRKWVNGELVDEVANGTTLDYSASDDRKYNKDAPLDPALQVDDSAFTKENNLVLLNELHDILDNSDEAVEPETSVKESKGGFLSKISSYFGGSADMQEVCKKFTDQLISKNIAPPTAQTIISRIQNHLNTNKVTIPVFKQALTDELTKILTPNVSTDLLYDIKRVSRNRAYVISVVGVNGVGKSTNLAKLAYWFLQNDLNVLICACDTFRSGAVEQLKVHVNNLNRLNASNEGTKIELFEKGYGAGDHVVNTAKSAIAYAKSENYDVVLIDTAGRTHSNSRLMAPLKKFGDAANPDKIIMVGEALVGTDSVEQAVNFNNAFGNKRGLDFFIISKVDTVGDLVGVMINMVMATKVPILFVGNGQTYTDIKKLSVKRVVQMLTT